MDTKAHPSSDRHDEQPMSIQCANRKEMNVSFKKRRKKKKKAVNDEDAFLSFAPFGFNLHLRCCRSRRPVLFCTEGSGPAHMGQDQ